MEIRKANSVPSRQIDAEKRFYHLFDQTECIITHIPAGHAQSPHRHQKIFELFFVIQGNIIIREGNRECDLAEGDSALIYPSKEYHTILNPTGKVAIIITIKIVPSSDSSRTLFAADKETP